MNSKKKKKEKQSHYRPGEAVRVPGDEAPTFHDSQHIDVVRFSALRTGRLYTPVNMHGTHFC